ncbi:MAG TPA: DinB family protein [Actinomycetes bacterium]
MVTPVEPPPEPSETLTDPRELLVGYLDYYRDAILRKLDGMSEEELRSSRLPSGWTPLALLKHLAGVERRWFRWGFAAGQVDDPRPERGPDGRWHVGAEETTDDVKALFRDECAWSRQIVAAAQLEDVARTGGGFNPPEHHPALIWILFHVLQEYARHAGHLDIIRELADGTVGE